MRPLIFFLFSAALCAQDTAALLDRCNVAWDTPANSSADSMPLGNGDIGLNVWVEKSGDLLFYISKTDAWSDNPVGENGLIKLGRVRVKLTPSPFADQPFHQILRLQQGEIEVRAANGSTLKIWVDANRPVIHVEAKTKSPSLAAIHLESWRTEPTKDLNADTIFPAQPGRIAWCYRNRNTQVAELRGLTFGAILKSASLRASKPSTQHSLAIYPLTAQVETPGQWLASAEKAADRSAVIPAQVAYRKHLAWWSEFWSRSFIYVDGDEAARKVTQGYALQRFVSACAGRGAWPIKFNGSIFTTDLTLHRKVNGVDQATEVNADYRAWGGQYWFQNTRPMYWPMLEAGDFEMMIPLFRMYQGMLQANAKSVRDYYGHGGSYFAETSRFFGGIGKVGPDARAGYIAHYFTPVLELTAMLLDYYDYRRDETFARERLLPVAEAGLDFFDQHFPRDAAGKLLLDPDNAIEMFWKVRNPLPDIAGLHYVLDRLLALPETLTGVERRAKWTRLRAQLPDLPRGQRDGKTVLLPFASADDPKPHNSENPELYAIHPFRLFGVGKPDLDLARDTFAARAIKQTGCWYQDPVQAALLGDADLASKDVAVNFSAKAADMRFPAFWTAHHDYAPDEDNGGNAMLALEYMLMQSNGRQILLLPAWPKGWDARFKLHAPQQTVVEGEVRNGELVKWTVTPPERRADVVIVSKPNR
jgi:hypothetical protein